MTILKKLSLLLFKIKYMAYQLMLDEGSTERIGEREELKSIAEPEQT